MCVFSLHYLFPFFDYVVAEVLFYGHAKLASPHSFKGCQLQSELSVFIAVAVWYILYAYACRQPSKKLRHTKRAKNYYSEPYGAITTVFYFSKLFER